MFNFLSPTSKTFDRGVHPGDFKELTRTEPIERVALVDEYVLPLSQHLGAPSKPVVSVGEKVVRGQLIAEPGGFVSAALHASVTGKIVAIEPRPHPTGRMVDSIIIKRDPYSAQQLYDEHSTDWESMEPAELLKAIQYGGFVGLGGAAFPTHVKMSVPDGKRVDFFMLNAAECEPYLTSDHRVMLEQPEAIFLGTRISMKILGATRCYLGAEVNKLDALAKLQSMIPADLPVEIVPLETKYPQGAEKMLTEAVLHKEIPSGKLPIDIHVVVNNVGTVAAIGDLFQYNQPVIERVVTVTGPGIRRPRNLLVPIGTSLSHVIDHCGGMTDDVRQILFGGPMMGNSVRTTDIPVTKGTSGVVFFTEREMVHKKEYPCIRCMRCVDACPVYLNPTKLGAMARAGHYDDMLNLNIMDCMECGSCSYVCPSNIPLVQSFRVGKAILREKMAREKAAGK
ncbi:electron transport complex subunit RsxC [candidate division KSB1 bacterium]|nr:electron transport complex subunit RsxC [candidate division KSB1 bacterium]